MAFLFWKNLRYLRKEKDLNQQEIGDLVNKGDGTISNWEKGNAEPSFSEINTISNFFGIEAVEMLFTDLEHVHLNEKNKGSKKSSKSPQNSPPFSPPNGANEPSEEYGNQTTLIKTLEDLVAAKTEIIYNLKQKNTELQEQVKKLHKSDGKKELPSVS
jgi:transcriptional regulator with XRE-family HTH domain